MPRGAAQRRAARNNTLGKPRRASAAHRPIPHSAPGAMGCSPEVADRSHCMNDFHIALLWLRSLELLIGHSPVLMLSELEMNDLFVRYRSPYKA
jgi:hypothetical protein